jgi:hypothetical protein
MRVLIVFILLSGHLSAGIVHRITNAIEVESEILKQMIRQSAYRCHDGEEEKKLALQIAKGILHAHQVSCNNGPGLYWTGAQLLVSAGAKVQRYRAFTRIIKSWERQKMSHSLRKGIIRYRHKVYLDLNDLAAKMTQICDNL